MSWIAVGLIGGSILGGASSLLKAGKKPQVPNYPRLDLDALQSLAISGNARSLPAAQALASGVNEANRAEVLKARDEAAPGALGQIQKNIGNQLSGVADVEDTAAAISNAQAVNFSLGAGGASQFSKFAVTGKLGRSVANQRQQGFQNFGALTSILEAPRLDPASMFLSPSQRVAVAAKEAEGQFNVEMARSAIKAQPSAVANFFGGALGAASNFAGMWSGVKLAGLAGASAGGASAYAPGFGAPPASGAGGSTGIPGRFNFPNSSYGKKGGWWNG